VSRSTGRLGKKSRWKKHDEVYRTQERDRRQANKRRREEVAAATAEGLAVDVWRKQQAGDQ